MRCRGCGHQQDVGSFCALCGAYLDAEPQAVGPRSPALVTTDNPAATTRSEVVEPGWQGWRGTVLVLLAVVLGFALVGLDGLDEGSSPSSAGDDEPAAEQREDEPQAPMDGFGSADGRRWPVSFFGPTDTVLLFDDGHEGAVVLDLDSGAEQRIPLPGQRSGDAAYRLGRLKDRVVVGREEIYAVTLGSTPSAELLGEAAEFRPAAEPDRIWLVDHARDSVEGEDQQRWSLVDAEGEELTSIERPVGEASPIRGVPGGLALRTSDSRLLRFEPDHPETIRTYLTHRSAHLADATEWYVAWCLDPCDALRISGTAGVMVAELDVVGPAVTAFVPDEVWLAPDGGRVAAIVTGRDDDGEPHQQLQVLDVATGALLGRVSLSSGVVHGDWTADGRQFFFALAPHPADRGDGDEVLGRWKVDGGVEQADVSGHLLGVGGFLALDVDSW